jgi:LysR family glycine cleavage system transcriptional activator
MQVFRNVVQFRTALLAFEAAARHQSFVKAAAELNVTQPAISRSVARIEERLGAELFVRTGRGIKLTDEGRMLFDAVVAGFQRIETALDDILLRQQELEVVTLSVSTAMVAHWFMARMDALRQEFPNVTFRFQTVGGEPKGNVSDVDLGVRLERFSDEANRSWLLANEVIFPVCSPAYKKTHNFDEVGPFGNDHTLLNYTDPRISFAEFYPNDAGKRFRARTTVFSDYSVIIQAAIAGKGLALGWGHLVANLIERHMLMRVGTKVLRTGRSYMLVAEASRPERDVVVRVREWIISQMRSDMDILEGRLYTEAS